MRITKLSPKNYRTLEDIQIEFPHDYCTLSGKNNAGKSCIIRLIRLLFEQQPGFAFDSISLDYSSDRTQWVSESESIEIRYQLSLSKDDDESLVNFIDKLSGIEWTEKSVEILVSTEIDKNNFRKDVVHIYGKEMSESNSKEVLRRIRSSNYLFLHNSTLSIRDFFFSKGGRMTPAYPIVFSGEDFSIIQAAEKQVRTKIRKLTKRHKSELEDMTGKLQDKYTIEFSTVDSLSSQRMHFDINLSDNSSEVPLDDWGSGTQNRTRILMSILRAKRSKSSANPDDRTAPIVVVEEPESFLHPTAQSEFGSLLQALSNELGIQIIASTHSPFMLNQSSPSSNILLKRKLRRNAYRGCEIVSTVEKQWMAPFAEHLGIIPPEFEKWKQLFQNHGSRALLVEGDTDKEYFEYLRTKFKAQFTIPPDVEIVPYDGKDALKNTTLLKFVLSKMSSCFLTFDLDAAEEVRAPLRTIGLVENQDFAAVGLSKPGREAIEGLLPDRVLSAVNGRETDLVMQSLTKDSKVRKEAKRRLKAKYLEEFKSSSNISAAELDPFAKLSKVIAARFA